MKRRALKRNVPRMDPEQQAPLDQIAHLVSDALGREVSRAAVTRAAMEAWLATCETTALMQLVAVVHRGIVKRGRRPALPSHPERAERSPP